MMLPRAIAIALSACVAPVALWACAPDLPSPSFVDDLRVLAVRAEPPETEPGGTVALDALVVDPADRVPTYAWYACIVVDQGQGFFGGGSETATSGGNGAGLSTDPYGGSCQRRFEAGAPFAQSLGTAANATLTIPADLFADDAALKLAYSIPDDLTIPADVKAGFLGIAGVNYTVSLVVDVDGRHIETQKRVNVSLPSTLANNDPNANPTDIAFHAARKADDVTAPATNDAPPNGDCFIAGSAPIAAGERYALSPVNIPDPQPKYVVLLAGTTTDQPFEIQTVDETSFYSWFATKGSLKKPISKAPGSPINEWTLGDDDAGPCDLWVVVRDGRGGVDWCHQAIAILPAGSAP